MNKSNCEFQFLKSALSVYDQITDLEDVVSWLGKQNETVNVEIQKIEFNQLKNWGFQDGRLVHSTGKFFSIDGLNVQTNWGATQEWSQPIINQPEVGYLGFITKEFNGILHFLLQAKIEPGNVNCVQLSPTLQATRSNYTQVHQGKKPLYLEYFRNASQDQIILDQLQSEQGARFLKKRNRNIILKIEEEIEVYENYIWLTLGQIKKLMTMDNLVNMDTRTVISGIPFGLYNEDVIDFFNYIGGDKTKNWLKNEFLKSSLLNNAGIHSFESIISFITDLKSSYDLNVKQCSLYDLEDWKIGSHEIYHKDHKYFKIIAVDVKIGNREVVNWTQPMVEPAQEGICVFVCKMIDGVLHFAVQAKMECGNHDIIEFAPTVQCLTGNYRISKEGTVPFLEYVLGVNKEQIIYDTLQSEEGGRFYREQNRNMIIFAADEFPETLPENFIWMTLSQINKFIKFNNYFNIQARSLIAAISFI